MGRSDTISGDRFLPAGVDLGIYEGGCTSGPGCGLGIYEGGCIRARGVARDVA